MIIYMYIYIIIYLLVEERECGVQTPNTKFFSKKKKKKLQIPNIIKLR